MQKFLIAVSLTGMVACQTEETRPKDLDIKATVGSNSASTESAIQLAKPEELNADKFLEWQKLYRGTPSSRDNQKMQSAIEQNPSPSTYEARLQRARNLLALGYRTEAKDMYGDLLRDSPEHVDTLIDMAHLFLGENNLERAFDYLNATKRILEKTERPGKAYIFRYRYALAIAYLQSKSRKQSADILADLLEQEPRFIPAYVALAQNYLQTKKYELAEFIIKRGLDYDSNDASLLNLMGVISLKRGRFEEAKPWIERSLSQSPEYVPALINRAHLSMRRREYATAENDLIKASKLDPSNLDAQLAIGILYKKTGRMSSAKLAFEKAISIDPQSSFARYHLGSILASDFKDMTGALQLFYDVLQSKEQDLELVSLAKAKIQSIRDSRLYEKSSPSEDYR